MKMKRLTYIFALICAFSCKPETYLGPLDSPVGNWDGVKGEFYFNGEMVAELDTCVITAISFYRQGYCCIEGYKGAYPFIYDSSNGDLQIDSTLWNVTSLTGAEMVMRFIDRIYPDPEPADPEKEESEDSGDKNGFELPVDYKGVTIDSDSFGYYYRNSAGRPVYCNFFGLTYLEGKPSVEFWYDTHTSYFIPLVVEEEKK